MYHDAASYFLVAASFEVYMIVYQQKTKTFFLDMQIESKLKKAMNTGK